MGGLERNRYGESKAYPGADHPETAKGTAINRNNFIRSLRRLCNDVGVEPAIAPYELRHTAISLQAGSGHTSWEIADWAGTSERIVSEVYRHRLQQASELKPLRRPPD